MNSGNTLKELRRSRKMTQREVANALKLSKSAWAMYESGDRSPRDEAKIRIADYFGTTVQSIFFREQGNKM